MQIKEVIQAGKAYMGIEFGSTRIKAVLIDSTFKPIAQGSYQWENSFRDGLWTYGTDEIWQGLRSCYADLCYDVRSRYGCDITSLSGIGISAMMHGYLPFDKKGEMLVPFRTWRNTNTGRAAEELSALFNFNIPLRWSISHLYQAILDNEPHVPSIDFLTTLAGYIHWKLTGHRVLGIGDASGMLPVDSSTGTYDSTMVSKFDTLISSRNFQWKLTDILPKSLRCGEDAGTLTQEGAKLLDPTGKLSPGIPLCPPEGDAGTGMVATNAVRPRTGNVSAGTSAFSMIVLERPLSKPYTQIDMVTTPDGAPVAMVHCNNCTSDLNGWVGLFDEFRKLLGVDCSQSEIYNKLFEAASRGDADCGGLLSFNFVSGEPVVGLSDGRPLFIRSATDSFTLSNFMRAILYSTVGALKAGNDILFDKERVEVDRITGHGGLFKSGDTGQRILAAALNSSISVMETAGEGGAWGIALLAAYPAAYHANVPLPSWLENSVFSNTTASTVNPDPDAVKGFSKYMELFGKCLPVEEIAVKTK